MNHCSALPAGPKGAARGRRPPHHAAHALPLPPASPCLRFKGILCRWRQLENCGCIRRHGWASLPPPATRSRTPAAVHAICFRWDRQACV